MAVPNCILIDECGVVEYMRYGGFDIRKDSFKKIVWDWGKGSLAEDYSREDGSEKAKSNRKTKADRYFRRGVNLYRQGLVNAALDQWKNGCAIDPTNWVIRKQIWALEHPEKFYEGSVDYCWQQEQVDKGV